MKHDIIERALYVQCTSSTRYLSYNTLRITDPRAGGTPGGVNIISTQSRDLIKLETDPIRWRLIMVWKCDAVAGSRVEGRGAPP